MTLRQQILSRWHIILKHTLNPLTRRLARRSFGPFSLIRHVGRHSGKSYETPLIVQPVANGFVVALTYGPDVDWYKNVLAAGGCTIVWQGRDFAIDRIESLDAETGRSAFPVPQRWIIRAVRMRHFVKMLTRGSEAGTGSR